MSHRPTLAVHQGRPRGAMPLIRRPEPFLLEPERQPTLSPVQLPDGPKLCRKCGVEKPRSEFYRDSAQKDGFAYRCKDCERERANQNRRAS